jgi:hypothetical protein
MIPRLTILAGCAALVLGGVSCDSHPWSSTSRLFKHGDGHGHEHKDDHGHGDKDHGEKPEAKEKH